MKRIICLVFAICFLLSGCCVIENVSEVTHETHKKNTSNKITSSTESKTEVSTPDKTTSTTETQEKKHSVYYADGIDAVRMAFLFRDVCFGNEYGDDKQIICKWEEAINLYIDGTPTDADLETLNELLNFFKSIDGFVGIRRVATPSQANLQLCFYDDYQFNALAMQQIGETNADGLATYNYTTATGVIFNGKIIIRTSIDQENRNSVIQEEVYQILGPTKDTTIRSDSIIYQYGNPPTLSKEDKSIMRLLYCDRIKAGMTPAQVEAIIKEIYY